MTNTPLNIEQIKLDAFKGQVRRYGLTPRNLVVGDNGTGKTGLLQAIQFACQGHTNLGKLDADTAQLAGPRGCTVATELSDGFLWTRTLDVKPDGNSQEIHIGGERRTTKAKSQAMVDAAVGDFAPMWDVKAFLELSADKRRDFIVDLCAQATKGDDGVNANRMLHRIALLTLRDDDLIGPGTVSEFLYARHKVENDDDATETMIVELMADKLSNPQRAAIDGLLKDIMPDLKGDASAAITAALEHAKSLTNAAKSEAEDGAGAALELAQRKSELSESVPAGDVARLLQAQRDCSDERDGLIDRIATQRKRDEQIADAETRRDALTSNILTLRGRLEQLEADPRDVSAETIEAAQLSIAALQDQLEAENDRLAEFRAHQQALRGKIVEKLDKARAELRKALTWKDEAVEAISAMTRECDNATIARQHLIDLCERHEADVLTQLRGLIVKLSGWLPAANARPDIEAVVAKALKLIDDNQKTDPRLLTVGDDTARHEATIKRCCDAIETHEKQRAEADKAIADGRKLVAKFEKQLAEFDAAEAPDDQRAALTQSVADADKALTALKHHAADIDKTRADIDRLGEERKALESRIQTLKDETEQTIDAMEARLAEVNESLADCAAKIKAKESYENINRELLAAQERAESRRLRHDMGKIIVKAIKVLREELTRKLTAPVTLLMDRFLAGVGEIKSYIELDNAQGKKAVFRIGWERPNEDGTTRRTPIEAMSGGENAIFTAALAYGLLMLADPPLKLLMIEAGEISARNLDALLQGVESVSDDIGNALIAAHVPVAGQAGSRDAEWQIIDMDAARNLAAVGAAA